MCPSCWLRDRGVRGAQLRRCWPSIAQLRSQQHRLNTLLEQCRSRSAACIQVCRSVLFTSALAPSRNGDAVLVLRMWVRCCSNSSATFSFRCRGAIAHAATTVQQQQQCSAHASAWHRPTCIPVSAIMLWWCRSGAVVVNPLKLRNRIDPIFQNSNFKHSMAAISRNIDPPSAGEVAYGMYYHVLYNHGAEMVVRPV